MRLLGFLLAFGAGAIVTLQIGSNARLREAMGGALPAIIVSSVLGIVLLWAAMLALQVPWPPLARMTVAPPSAWLGGVLGAVYAVVTVVLARHVAAGCGLMVGGFFLILKF